MYSINFVIYPNDNVIPTDDQDSTDWLNVVETGFIYFEGETAEESLYNLIQALNNKPHQIAAHVLACTHELYIQFEDINLLAVKFIQY